MPFALLSASARWIAKSYPSPSPCAAAAPAAYSKSDHCSLITPWGASVFDRLFHAISGAIASTRLSSAAVTNWIPPAYEPPLMPMRGSPAAS